MSQPETREYNLADLQCNFVNSLSAGNLPLARISIKNYSSDLSHFFAWYMKSHHLHLSYTGVVSAERFLSVFSHDLVDAYRAYLIDANTPIKTINRRLSTIRKFASFCLTHSLVNSDPAYGLKNVSAGSLKQTYHNSTPSTLPQRLLDEYKKDTDLDSVAELSIYNFLKTALSTN